MCYSDLGVIDLFYIFCDSIQEGLWFKKLDPHLSEAELVTIPSNITDQRRYGIESVLIYDRPDIILKEDNEIIFVLERTIEVPSGHNVGQRFGRLVAAARAHIPVAYFGPYAAYKHGADTAGPRYMNLRLFYSLANVARFYDTAVTTINWPVDEHYEVIKKPEKDVRICEYLKLFFSHYDVYGMNGINRFIANSTFQQGQTEEQQRFAATEVRNPEQYDLPPASVEIITYEAFARTYGELPASLDSTRDVLVYHIGMNYIRSDPYTGMAALYYYLYTTARNLTQILHFPNITSTQWRAQNSASKTYRMFKEFCNGILFSDGLVLQADL